MNGLFQDVRYALRQIRKSPGFALSAVVVLALGIGATTGMLATVQSVLVRPLEYWRPEQLMLVDVSGNGDEGGDWFVVPTIDFPELRRNLRQFEQLAAFSSLPEPVDTEEGTQMLLAPEVSTNFFQTLGVLPELGRSFREGDDAPGANAAIVSHEFWQNSMNRTSAVLGSKLKVNGHLYTIVGVMPPRFQFPVTFGKSVWTALQLTPDHKTSQGLDNFQVLGRLRPGVTPEQARAEGEAFLRNRPHSSEPANPAHFGIHPYQRTITGEARPALLALLAACVVLLLIAIVNTANLQIARATTRQNEIAMRSALGASRVRIVRQMIVESLILSCSGAALSSSLAAVFVSVAHRLFPQQPRFDSLQFDPSALAACLLITFFCGVAAAIAPSWHVLRNRQDLLVPSSARMSRRSRLSGWLVAAEVALSTVLLVAAGLFLRTLRSLENVPLGFKSENVITFLLWAEGGNTLPMPVKAAAYHRVLDQLEQLPNVEAAGMVTSLPISNFQMASGSDFSVPGHLSGSESPAPFTLVTAVSPGYFRALGIRVTSGRGLSATDTASTQLVGIVNQALVDKYLRNVNPIGQEIVLEKPTGILQPVTIVGVSGNVIQFNSIGNPVEPELALSYLQLPPTAQFSQYLMGFADAFAIRTRPPMGDIGASIRAIVKREAVGFAIDDLVPYPKAVQDNIRNQRLTVQITSCFAWIAVFLSAAGIYAVLAFVVGQRTHEMGIRLALGATRGNVFNLITRQGLGMVGAGLICGYAVSLLTGRWIRSFLYGVTSADPVTYGTVGILVVLASMAAIFVPARRAASLEPTVALRSE